MRFLLELAFKNLKRRRRRTLFTVSDMYGCVDVYSFSRAS